MNREALLGMPSTHVSTTLCERQSENKGSMPFSSLNRVRLDRQMAMSDAWQRWTELPEGASLLLRFDGFTSLSNPPRSFDIEPGTLARRSESPSAERRVRCLDIEELVPTSELADTWKMECLMQKRCHRPSEFLRSGEGYPSRDMSRKRWLILLWRQHRKHPPCRR